MNSFRICWFTLVMAVGVSGAEPAIHQAQGVFIGEPTATSVLLQTRLTAIAGPKLDAENDVPGSAGVGRFEYGTSPKFTDTKTTEWLLATAPNDFIIRAQIANLQPFTTYYFRSIVGKTEATAQPGQVGQFRTLPAPDSTDQVKFCMGSCMNYHSFMSGKANGGGPVTATAEDKELGYRVFKTMHLKNPDFFIGTGDIVYYDHPGNMPATTLPELHKKWHEQFRFPRLMEFFARTPAYWSKDDHDFRFNDSDLSGQRLPLAKTGIDLFRQQMPIFAADDTKTPTYRTHRINKHLQIWLVEGRDFRSPIKMKDGPEKSIWGKEQRDWLQKTLLASDAKYKILISPTPMVGPDRASKKDNHTNLNGYRHEAEAFFDWCKANKQNNLLIFCGDRHWQYHSIHPCGIEEFGCGALNDENAISGVKPGTKNSTDPMGLLKQPYLYDKPTGGFIFVQQATDEKMPTLKISHYDDQGKILNQCKK
ncbi:MAG: alkaline phosphatase D family protein [Zavarzinella sp.]